MKTKFKLTEQDYRYLFENASDAMWVHDMKGNFLDANKAFEKLTGYTLEEWTGLNVTQFLNNESLALAEEVRRKLLRGEAIVPPYEQQFFLKNGSIRAVTMATSPVVIGGEVKGFQHVARDVTEEKKLQENMHFYVQQVTRVQEEERKRVARHLHDDVAPSLLLLIQRLDAILLSTPRLSTSLKNKLEDLHIHASAALESLRRSAQDLRPRIIDDLGLIAAIEWMAENFIEDYGIDTQFEVIGVEQGLTDEVQLLLFRIAQEALTNIRRHAEASRAWITLEFGEKKVVLTIKDNGKGFEMPQRMGDLASAGKLGLAGMQERAELIGGSLRIQSEPGKGTTVTIEVPI